MVKTADIKTVLEVVKRDIFGKKLHRLRKSGQIPANVFGPDFQSVSIAVGEKDFFNVYKTAQETGIVYLHLGTDEIPVLIKQLQFHPVTDKLLHVDFRKIDLQKKILRLLMH